ncbi:prolyl oligopeptidase family serine peptidase [Maribacter aestuarii]|uniref:carboxylesterase family protein n=1 Tax=Maribacter aestuarii TaxID=1130723 RepID=UPI0025A58ACD|nr:prolyl oligopeptidase family serine peptidase [Maribacter aestuarii]
MSRLKGVCIFFSCLLFYCGTTQELSKSEKSFTKIKVSQGIQNKTLSNHYGNKYQVILDFPDTNLDKYQLIIALHWAGGGDTYKTFFECLALPGLEDDKTVIIAPEGENQLWSTENNVTKVINLVTYAIKYWNVDPEKIAVMGYSNGGNGSWYFAEHHPETFSAAIPMASSYAITEKIGIPLYVIHGERDELFSVTKTSEWVRKSKEAGSDITFVKNESLSHFQGCSYVGELKRAHEWLQNLWKDK